MPAPPIQPSRRRFHFLPVVLAPILIVMALGAWMFASPIGASPDDNFHLPSSWCGLGERPGLCEPGDSAQQRSVPKGVAAAPLCYREKPLVAANCQDRVLWSGGMTSTAAVNTSGLYPPIFYAVMALLASPHVVSSALMMRLLNILFFVVLATLVYIVLPPFRRPSLAVAGLITMVPLGSFLIASNNPSSWAVTSALIVWVSIAGSFETTGIRRWVLAALALIGAVMGAGARADAAVFDVIAAAVAIAIAMRRGAAFRVGVVVPIAVAIAAVGMFFTANQVSAASAGGLATSQGTHSAVGIPLLTENIFQLPSLWVGVFGTWALGWFDTAMPTLVWVASFGAFVFTVTLFMRRASRRKIAVMVGLLGLLVAIPLVLLQSAQSRVGDAVQPRYLLPLLIMAAGVALWHDRVHHGLTVAQGWWIVGTLTLANAVALHVNMRRYISGTNPRFVSINLNDNLLWWWAIPVGPTVVWAVGAIAFGIGTYLIVWHSLNVGKRRHPLDTGPIRLPNELT